MNRKILVRFDDLCPTMNYTQWQRAVRILETYDVHPLLGVIPDCRDPELQIEPEHADFWKYMRTLQQKGYTLAMHGYQHVYDRKQQGLVNESYRTEFAGHPYEVQYEKIRKGKQALLQHGIQTDVFFAPSHSYDEATLRALAENGFRYVSDGKSIKPFLHNGVICIPCHASGAAVIRGPGYYTSVFHAHEWVRPDKAQGYDELVALCKEYHDEIVDFTEYARRPLGNASAQLLSEKAMVVWERRCKPVLRKVKHAVLR